MILRRIIAHFRKQEWTAIFLDFVIVVTGVFIGIQVANWNADRATRRNAEIFTQRLIADLEIEAWAYAHYKQYYKDVRQSAERALAALTGESSLGEDRLLIEAYRATQYSWVERRRAAHDELVATGNIGLIANVGLREAAVELYNSPLIEDIWRESLNADFRRLFRMSVPIETQRALLRDCGDGPLETLNYELLDEMIGYDCSLDLPPETIAEAVSILKADPAIVEALRLRVATLDGRLTDLDANYRWLQARDFTFDAEGS